jgi:hypothetical protein
MASFCNFFLVDKAGLRRLALLTLATVFASAFMLPLTLKTQMPVPQEFTPDSFASEAKEILKEWRNEVVREKLFYKDSALFFATRERYVGRLLAKAEYLAEQTTNSALEAERDKRRLFTVQAVFAGALISVYLLALTQSRSHPTIEYAVPLVTGGMIIWRSLESGATAAMLLAILVAALGLLAKIVSDNRRTELKWPRMGKALVAFAALFPMVMVVLGVLFVIGDWIDARITRAILSTEASLLFGLDSAGDVIDDLTRPRSAWLDPMEWLVWRPLRAAGREAGTHAIAGTGFGIRLAYSCLRAVFSLLQVASLVGFVWLVIRAFAFVACRSVLYGGGGFVFRLPPPASEPIQRASRERS